MALSPGILQAQVTHKRLSPKVNAFTYGLYYVALPLSQLESLSLGKWFSINRPGIMSFYNSDHGTRTGQDLLLWIKDILSKYKADHVCSDVLLVTMPRTFGYVFNPISFWLCYDDQKVLRAILCEVNNTFGQTHSYLCLHEDHREIKSTDIFQGDKHFHVSPFLKRVGLYRFRFAKTDKGFGAWIDYEEEAGTQKLLTVLTGSLGPFTQSTLKQAFWRHPMVSLRAVFLIHWQAVKLLFKGIRYIPKPEQLENTIERTFCITNN